MIHLAHALGSTALATERAERKLAVILAADIAGYTCTDQYETKLRDLSV
jgi:hypothetical protein